ncbi:MAG: hypothetical protein WAT22_04685 [Saprospiraceae bacterium]|nr:hypothetical protein [Saprospiraceae bacterium]MBP6446316.1 hypothetical protein [Saprospiraceae bacterium]
MKSKSLNRSQSQRISTSSCNRTCCKAYSKIRYGTNSRRIMEHRSNVQEIAFCGHDLLISDEAHPKFPKIVRESTGQSRTGMVVGD